MAKYLIHGNYVNEGVAGLLEEGGTSRETAVAELVASLGGSMEAWYYAFGDTDVYAIVDLPSPSAAAALSLIAGASGRTTVTTTVLMTSAEMDEASRLSPSYRAPGT
jgi:uncharacterized protein with GYD domain